MAQTFLLGLGLLLSMASWPSTGCELRAVSSPERAVSSPERALTRGQGGREGDIQSPGHGVGPVTVLCYLSLVLTESCLKDAFKNTTLDFCSL